MSPDVALRRLASACVGTHFGSPFGSLATLGSVVRWPRLTCGFLLRRLLATFASAVMEPLAPPIEIELDSDLQEAARLCPAAIAGTQVPVSVPLDGLSADDHSAEDHTR